jgi:hypothetical protein
MFYNFCRIHQTLRVTPAMATGVTKRLWEMTDLVEMVEAWEESGRLAGLGQVLRFCAIQFEEKRLKPR